LEERYISRKKEKTCLETKALQAVILVIYVYKCHTIVLKDASVSKEGEPRTFEFQITAVEVSRRSVGYCDFY